VDLGEHARSARGQPPEAEIQRLTEEREKVLLEARAREAEQAKTRAHQLELELEELKAEQTDRGLVLTLGDVLFEYDKADLKPGAMRNLYPLVTFLKEHPERDVLIEGHTDSVGSDSYNLNLSQHRTESVRNFLVLNSIDPTRITARGYGEAYPVTSNETEAGRQQNRRVEVVILREGEQATRWMR
jgi:outer membrane protein OmpA-like peptidoglycan-associated protein